MKKSISSQILTLSHNFIVDYVYKIFPDKQVDICEYFFFQKKFPNLKHPKTLSEKIQWAKLYGHLDRYSKYVCKYEVRDIIAKTIGSQYLIPLLGIWDNFDDIDFDKLPGQFALKATHGSHYVYVCQDKSTINKKSLKKTFDKWLHENFYQKFREIQYRDCRPRIIAERYLQDYSGGLMDYKIYCFHGRPHFIELVADRYTEMTDTIMDLDWKKLPVKCVGYHGSDKIYKKPSRLKDMLNIAKKLSAPFPYVRVDLYSVDNKIYFGELTFTPGNGVEPFDPPSVENELGDLLDLSKYDSKISPLSDKSPTSP